MYFNIPYLVLTLLSGMGFWIALHIRGHKVTQRVLVCPLGSDCNAVIHSRFSTILGVPVEVVGLAYYATSFFLYVALASFPVAHLPEVILTAMILSGLAFLFSLYLTAMQLFVLREICVWCLFSFAITTVIAILVQAISTFSVSDLLFFSLPL